MFLKGLPSSEIGEMFNLPGMSANLSAAISQCRANSKTRRMLTEQWNVGSRLIYQPQARWHCAQALIMELKGYFHHWHIVDHQLSNWYHLAIMLSIWPMSRLDAVMTVLPSSEACSGRGWNHGMWGGWVCSVRQARDGQMVVHPLLAPSSCWGSRDLTLVDGPIDSIEGIQRYYDDMDMDMDMDM